MATVSVPLSALVSLNDTKICWDSLRGLEEKPVVNLGVTIKIAVDDFVRALTDFQAVAEQDAGRAPPEDAKATPAGSRPHTPAHGEALRGRAPLPSPPASSPSDPTAVACLQRLLGEAATHRVAPTSDAGFGKLQRELQEHLREFREHLTNQLQTTLVASQERMRPQLQDAGFSKPPPEFQAARKAAPTKMRPQPPKKAIGMVDNTGAEMHDPWIDYSRTARPQARDSMVRQSRVVISLALQEWRERRLHWKAAIDTALLERCERSLRTKIRPDNVNCIVERLARMDLHKVEDLRHVVHIIVSRALAEPHNCETYADIAFSLCDRYPEFLSDREGKRPHTLTAILLNTCQYEYESLLRSFEPTKEEAPVELQLSLVERKARLLAIVKLIASLFLRKLITPKVIGWVVHDLIGVEDAHPEEYMLECACYLLQLIGYALDNTQSGRMVVSQFLHRLVCLKKVTHPETGQAKFSKRVQAQIQDLIDLRRGFRTRWS